MSDHHKGALGEPELNVEHVRQAWEFATLEAMKVHRQTGVPVTTWDRETGQIVMIPADEIMLPDDLVHAEQSAPSSEPR